MPEIGALWTHMGGAVRKIIGIGPDWVEPEYCGRWQLADFEKQWHLSVAAPLPPPEMIADYAENDGTERAHPAWSRGYEAGRAAVQRELLVTLQTGVLPHDSTDIARQVAAVHAHNHVLQTRGQR